MKYLCCAALLLAGYAHAGELLPVRGDEAESVQERLDEYTLPAIKALADHIFLGPFAGDSHIKLRIRIVDGDKVTETLIEDEGGNWKGTVQWGQDGNMLEDVAIKAAEFISGYSKSTAE
jgi:hypothetical protein